MCGHTPTCIGIEKRVDNDVPEQTMSDYNSVNDMTYSCTNNLVTSRSMVFGSQHNKAGADNRAPTFSAFMIVCNRRMCMLEASK